MAGVTYKCASCGAFLVFNPERQRWQCPFCNTEFEEKELSAKADQYQQEAEQEQAHARQAGGGEQLAYHCPSCGSEIVTDATTVATQCYYCHNPVVLQGKLTADMKPDSVLPFSIGKEKAVDTFMNWVRKKKFVPKGFFSEAGARDMTGVYYPHFVTECEVEGSFDGEGRNTSVAETAKYIITKTDHYRVRREGEMTFANIMRPALTKANRKLSDGIHPFPLGESKPFSGAYLSGFLAERRDIDAESIAQDIGQEVKGYVEPLLTDDTHYNSCSGQTKAKVTRIRSRYVLLPTWVLTYPNKQDVQDPYYYAMNGCSGEVCGKLPIHKSKLFLTGGAIAAAIFVVGCVLSYFLF